MNYELKPFGTDGCSGNMSWLWGKIWKPLNILFGHTRTPELPWHEDCVQHDKTYWLGGNRVGRLRADVKLMEAVAAKGYNVIGVYMFLAVQLGGYGWRAEVSYWLMRIVNWNAKRFNWGYGFGPSYRYKHSKEVFRRLCDGEYTEQTGCRKVETKFPGLIGQEKPQS